ncbi:MAG TPA: hypothetical protein VIL46_13330, partial [Gemmataceae bacterium]
VAAKDADGDARADLVTGPGPGAPPVVNVYLARDLTPQGTPPAARELTAFDPGFGGGVFVG